MVTYNGFRDWLGDSSFFLARFFGVKNNGDTRGLRDLLCDGVGGFICEIFKVLIYGVNGMLNDHIMRQVHCNNE